MRLDVPGLTSNKSPNVVNARTLGAIMSRLILLIFSLTLFGVSNAQTSTSLSQSDIDLINTAIKDKRHGIKLVAEMTEYDLSEIKRCIDRGIFFKRMVDENDKNISDSIKLSQRDKKQLLNTLKLFQNFKWTDTVIKKLKLENISLISFDTSITNNLTYAIKYHIVPPLYFQNNKYCILSFSYSCGGLCGHGQITIYKMTEKGWTRWNHLSWWDE